MIMTTKKLAINIEKPDDFFIKTNLLENRYVTDGTIWTIDETIFNAETKLFLVVSLNTRAILGYIQGKNCRNEDLVIELYEEILDEYEFASKPCFVHSDMEQTYHSEKVQEFLSEKGIYVSTTGGSRNQNQVSESVNARIKYLVAHILLDNPNVRSYREFSKTLPENLQNIRKKSQKCNDNVYRKHLFNSNLFKNQRQQVIEEAILLYNKTPYTDGVTREEAQYYDSFVKGRDIDNTRLVRSDDNFSQLIQDDNISSINEVKTKISEILSSDAESEVKIGEIIAIVAQRQDSSTEVMKKGFVGLAVQNTELQNKIDKLYNELEIVTNEIQEKRKQDLLVLERKERRKKRKRLPAKDPITEEIYEYLIEKAEKDCRETYQGARLRLALALLVVTGVRISELLPLKVAELENLFAKSWISIDRLKRGPSSHKAFLTKKGKNVIKKRAKDFEIVLYSKQQDSYVFTPQYSNDPLNRESFNRIVNIFLIEASKELFNQPNIKSHSFRIGFITELWRDTKDIEFVRQAIGHAKIDTTSRYVQNLTEEERQSRMINLETPEDLLY
jgi:site-specific recombinase XerD